MDNNINKALDKFLDKNEPIQNEEKKVKAEAETLKSKDGLIERIEKTFITESGKILLND